MAFLITYPKEKVAPKLQAQLARLTTTLYIPLRELVATQLSPAEVNQVQTAAGIVITSQFALHVFLSRNWHFATPPDCFVISQKMASRLQANGYHQVAYPAAENQASLAQLLTATTSEEVVWLTGNRHVKHNQLATVANLNQITLYKNSWSQEQENQVVAQLKDVKITRVLVTSPSSYSRLQTIETRLSSQFSSVAYYTLGHSTFALINDDHKSVAQPVNKRDVLTQMLRKMCADEMANQ
ncbi:uroporphyrinogen-III synthase [Secundilactobacillus collinoides]|uniref:Tetrapyrrole biosynthesis uroporphyrinogen III synthase domain-containing protein n=1 Tax=Secundilactobacillus collinoides TaxID=33960 RepID=A0A161VG03_SECCO|nr:uroporphyrinogen-III synthase [Secundilactobacillus collinoides]KZL37036.1 hypothetical protein TY91_13380 [Secundilactobacillus collinoides]